MGEYAAFLLILVFGFACGYGTARARGEKKGEPGTLPDPPRPAPPMTEVKTPRMNMSERELTILCMQKAGMPDEHIMQELAKQGDQQAKDYLRRRRDDNRAQRAPEEPWQ